MLTWNKCLCIQSRNTFNLVFWSCLRVYFFSFDGARLTNLPWPRARDITDDHWTAHNICYGKNVRRRMLKNKLTGWVAIYLAIWRRGKKPDEWKVTENSLQTILIQRWSPSFFSAHILLTQRSKSMVVNVHPPNSCSPLVRCYKDLTVCIQWGQDVWDH